MSSNTVFSMRTQCLFFTEKQKWSSRTISFAPHGRSTVLQVEKEDRKKRVQTVRGEYFMKQYLGCDTGFDLRGERNTLCLVFTSASLTLSFPTESLRDAWQHWIVYQFGNAITFPLELEHRPGYMSKKETMERNVLFVKDVRFSIIRYKKKEHLIGGNMRSLTTVSFIDNTFIFSFSDLNRYPTDYYSFLSANVRMIYNLFEAIKKKHLLSFKLLQQTMVFAPHRLMNSRQPEDVAVKKTEIADSPESRILNSRGSSLQNTPSLEQNTPVSRRPTVTGLRHRRCHPLPSPSFTPIVPPPLSTLPKVRPAISEEHSLLTVTPSHSKSPITVTPTRRTPYRSRPFPDSPILSDAPTVSSLSGSYYLSQSDNPLLFPPTVFPIDHAPSYTSLVSHHSPALSLLYNISKTSRTPSLSNFTHISRHSQALSSLSNFSHISPKSAVSTISSGTYTGVYACPRNILIRYGPLITDIYANSHLFRSR